MERTQVAPPGGDVKASLPQQRSAVRPAAPAVTKRVVTLEAADLPRGAKSNWMPFARR